jgi:hypothetical protein
VLRKLKKPRGGNYVRQHPLVTVSWTINSLEAAIRNLGDGPAERRVRRQFHQLIVALEHDTQSGILTPPPEPRGKSLHF